VKHWLRHPSLTLAVSAALALASGTAAALGLGQIEVRSRAGQPLLAEIPVISTTPGELEKLQARLASPETFARVGLQAPQGLVTGLRFSVANDRAGRPVIRVTTDEPVDQPLVTFLLEVDWGQGRLVREYSALVDTPQAVAAPAQPPIQAPAAAPSNIVGRPAQTPQRPAPAPHRPAAEPRPVRPDAQPAAGGAPGEYGPVRRGETLSLIASRLGLADDHTLDQAMIALLRANPDAFIDNDINRLRQGAVLRVPQTAQVAAVDAAQASQIVRDRMRQWREARQQAVVAAEAAQAGAPRDAARPTPPQGTTAQAAGKAQPPAAAGARLEIVPPAANRATQAGTQSGIQAGGEGQMLRQELQQTRETLAARDAELQDLKSRIAELEKLQGDQQKLLALKNSELAAAQQRLATTGQVDAPQPGAAAGAPARDSLLPWLLGGAALLALLLGGWRVRRRSAAQSPFRAPPQSAASELAAAFPLRYTDEAGERRMDEDGIHENEVGKYEVDEHEVDERRADEDLLVVPPRAADDAAIAPIASSHADVAARDADGFASEIERAAASTTDEAEPSDAAPANPRWSAQTEPVATPTWHAPPTPVAPVPLVDMAAPRIDAPVPEAREAPAEAPVNERLELAQAYLDLGDHDSARQLLGEVVVTGDHASRQRARRMLREIG
jgi:pilus assembly protein FimV